MSALKTIGRTIGRGLQRGVESKALVGTIVAGAALKGLSDTVGKSSIKNAMDVAFDDPNADRNTIGTDLTPSLLVSQAGLGPISAGAKAMNLDKYGFNPGGGAVAAGMPILGGLGAITGGVIGGALQGKRAGFAGALIGGAIGASAPFVGAMHYAKSNARLMSQSPNSSLSTANQLNASGDIVLGMHNSRRG